VQVLVSINQETGIARNIRVIE